MLCSHTRNFIPQKAARLIQGFLDDLSPSQSLPPADCEALRYGLAREVARVVGHYREQGVATRTLANQLEEAAKHLMQDRNAHDELLEQELRQLGLALHSIAGHELRTRHRKAD